MDSLFPLSLPAASAFYMTLYLLTFMIHHAMMHYVMAGSLYIAWATAFPGSSATPRSEQPLALLIRDWTPFMLSGAITAGIAPLLFIQILYQKSFYTANLLLGWRWMLIIPVLIIAFYLLYLLKSSVITKWPSVVRVNLPLFTALCFLFVGFCWTVNNSVGNHEENWAKIYTDQTIPVAWSILARMGIWIAGSFATLAVITGWQIASKKNKDSPENGTCDLQAKQLASVSLFGLTMAGISAGIYYWSLEPGIQSALLGPSVLLWLMLAIVGVIVQVLGWLFQFRNACLCRKHLTMVTTGLIAALSGTTILREVIRLQFIDIHKLYPLHEKSSQVGGLSVFLLFALMNTILIVYCLRLVRTR